MAITAITDISTERILLNPGDQRAKVVRGTLAADYTPGTLVVSISNVWTTADSDTAAHKLMKWGVVGYEKRINTSTGAVIPITTAWDADVELDVPIITSGICVVGIDDLGASANVGTGVMVGANAGICALQDNAQIDHASLAIDVVDDDVFTIVGIGECNGEIWGGFN